MLHLFERITRRDLAVFSRQFALMLDLGVTVLRALNIISQRTANRRLKTIVGNIGQIVEQGESLSHALGRFRTIFGDFFVTSVQAGEESGQLSEVMNQLADYLEKEDALGGKIQKALAFPLITLLMAFAVIIFLLIYVIPIFASVYSDAGVELPFITKSLIKSSQLVQSYWWIILLAAVFAFLLFHKSGRWLRLTAFMDSLSLKTPIVRTLMIKLATFRFASITSTMIESGVSILPTMNLAAAATGNSVLKAAILRSCGEIDKGSNIEQALTKHPALPPLVIDMIGVGEEVGAVGTVLKKVADFYLRDVDDMVSNLTTVLEPILTLVMGILVALIALGMFLPYFNLTQVVLN